MAISSPLKAIMKDKGRSPITKKKRPLAMMLYVKPLKIAKSKWPETIFAASLRPNDTALDKYEINSIKTRRGSKARGVPAGTKREKNSTPCFWNPRIVAPRTILKLKEKASIKCEVDAKLYGTIPIKLFIKINTNKEYIKGKYNWPFFSFIWLTTILCTVAYKDSFPIDQLFDPTLL